MLLVSRHVLMMIHHADLSIAPGNVTAVRFCFYRSLLEVIHSYLLNQNTNSTALAIAERAAAIIGEELGIEGI